MRRGDRRPAPASGGPEGAGTPEGERRDQHDDDRRRDPVAELDHRVLLQERQRPPAAQRPALGAAALRAAAEARVAHADHPADHDQRERREDGRGQQAAEAEQSSSASPRGATHASGSGYRGAARRRPRCRPCPTGSGPVGARAPAVEPRAAPGSGAASSRCGRGSPGGCRRAAPRCARRERRRSCGSGAGRAANHSSVAAPHGSCPAATPLPQLWAALPSSRRTPTAITKAPIEATRLEPSRPVAREELVDVDRLPLERRRGTIAAAKT